MSPHHGDRPHEQGERQQSQRGEFPPRQAPAGRAGGRQPPTGAGNHPQGQGSQFGPPGGASQQPPTQGRAPPGQGGGQPSRSPPGQSLQQRPSGQGQAGGSQHQPGQPRPHQSGGGAPQQGVGTQQPAFGAQQQGSPAPHGQPPGGARQQGGFGGPQSQPHGGQGHQQGPGGPVAGPATQGPPPMGGAGGRRGIQLRPVTVADVIQGEPVTVEADTPVPTIVAEMDEADVGSVVVVDDDEPMGIVTDRTIAMGIEQYDTVAELAAEDLITGDLVTATEEDTVFDVLRTFREEGIRRLPVVDEEGALIGVVSLDDVIVLLATEIGNVGETIQAQIERL